MMKPLDVGRIIQIVDLKKLFSQGDPFFSHGQGFCLLINIIVNVILEIGNDPVHLIVEFRVHVGRAGNNQRRSGFIDQNTVHLINNGIIEISLTEILLGKLHIVPEIIKTELIVGAIGDIGMIRLPTGLIIHIMKNRAK